MAVETTADGPQRKQGPPRSLQGEEEPRRPLRVRVVAGQAAITGAPFFAASKRAATLSQLMTFQKAFT